MLDGSNYGQERQQQLPKHSGTIHLIMWGLQNEHELCISLIKQIHYWHWLAYMARWSVHSSHIECISLLDTFCC